jgi:hypothetical protein
MKTYEIEIKGKECVEKFKLKVGIEEQRKSGRGERNKKTSCRIAEAVIINTV